MSRSLFKMFNTIVKAGMAESGDGRSCCFVARLGALDSLDRFETWASSTCSEHALVRDENGAVTMYAQRETAKTARQWQSLIRTLMSQWGMAPGKMGKGWLTLLSTEEYRAAVPGPPATSGLGEGESGGSMSKGQSGPPCPVLRSGAVLHALSAGFDERAAELCRRMITAGT